MLLTAHFAPAKARGMHKLALTAPIALATLLVGCGPPTTITSNGPADVTATEIAKAPPVKLPPALLDSKTYRCQPGNTVYYVDWFNDNMTATLKTKKDGDPIPLSAPVGGQPYVGGGYTVTGSATATGIEIKGPTGKLACTG